MNKPISNQKTKSFRVGLYMRLSREDGDKEESSSVTNQREILKRYVSEQENFFIVKEYVDDGYTGTNFDRPGFKQMIEDIEAGIIDTVITKDLSRLGRERLGVGHYTEIYFPEHNVRYIALLDNIDTYFDAGMNDMAPFKGVINDMYVRDISKKIRSSLTERRKAGTHLLPLNYLLAILFSTCCIIFLTIFPPILPASLADISPLYPSFKVTPTSEATSSLNLSKALIASGTNFLLLFKFAMFFHLLLYITFLRKNYCFF